MEDLIGVVVKKSVRCCHRIDQLKRWRNINLIASIAHQI